MLFERVFFKDSIYLVDNDVYSNICRLTRLRFWETQTILSEEKVKFSDWDYTFFPLLNQEKRSLKVKK